MESRGVDIGFAFGFLSMSVHWGIVPLMKHPKIWGPKN